MPRRRGEALPLRDLLTIEFDDELFLIRKYITVLKTNLILVDQPDQSGSRFLSLITIDRLFGYPFICFNLPHHCGDL